MRRQVMLRVDEGLLGKVDERAAEVGISRNQWLVAAAEWALARKGVEIVVTETRKVSL